MRSSNASEMIRSRTMPSDWRDRIAAASPFSIGFRARSGLVIWMVPRQLALPLVRRTTGRCAVEAQLVARQHPGVTQVQAQATLVAADVAVGVAEQEQRSCLSTRVPVRSVARRIVLAGRVRASGRPLRSRAALLLQVGQPACLVGRDERCR